MAPACRVACILSLKINFGAVLCVRAFAVDRQTELGGRLEVICDDGPVM